MFKRKMNLTAREKNDRKVVNIIANASAPLNVVAHPSFKDVSRRALRKVKSIVSRLNKSGNIKEMFKRHLKEDQLPGVIPMNDAPTWYSSTNFMFCNVLNALPAVEKLMHAYRMTPFDDAEIRVLKAMKVFLQPLQHMISQVCFQPLCVPMFIPIGKLLRELKSMAEAYTTSEDDEDEELPSQEFG
ncbi:hypothetical protein Aduo_019028 [Ancylostoma duodenale]